MNRTNNHTLIAYERFSDAYCITAFIEMENEARMANHSQATKQFAPESREDI